MKEDDGGLNCNETRDLIRIQAVVVHLTLDSILLLFACPAVEHFSASLHDQAVTSSIQQDCCLRAQSMSGGICAILRFERRRTSDACSFSGNRIHHVG